MTSKIIKSYFIHLAIGILALSVNESMFIFTLAIPIIGTWYIIKNQNKNHEVLIVCAYIVGIEILLRMTNTMIFNEYGKYFIMLFLLIGIFYSSFSNYSLWFVFFTILLIPGVIYGSLTLSHDVEVRKAIAFNISGQASLVMSAIYCYKRQISIEVVKKIIYTLSLPVFSIVTYVILRTPSNLKDVIINTQSNFATSGGFGPNQMSTVLGLATFCCFALFLTLSNNKNLGSFFLLLTAIFAYRGIITFSRGGMMTAGLMILILLFSLYRVINTNGRLKLQFIMIITFFLTLGVWIYSSIQTDGMIDKRYLNQNKTGLVKEDRLGGREKLIETEINMFLENPIFGIGVGKNKQYREEMSGHVAASHNEVTRMLAEHGSLGILGLLILLIIPLANLYDNKYHIFLLSFYVFWFLTIQHAAMRTAMPGFIYGLTLLKIIPFNKSLDKQNTT
jgi:O-antigen ligase